MNSPNSIAPGGADGSRQGAVGALSAIECILLDRPWSAERSLLIDRILLAHEQRIANFGPTQLEVKE